MYKGEQDHQVPLDHQVNLCKDPLDLVVPQEKDCQDLQAHQGDQDHPCPPQKHSSQAHQVHQDHQARRETKVNEAHGDSQENRVILAFQHSPPTVKESPYRDPQAHLAHLDQKVMQVSQVHLASQEHLEVDPDKFRDPQDLLGHLVLLAQVEVHLKRFSSMSLTT